MKTVLASDPGDERPRCPILFDRAIYSRPDDDHLEDLATAVESLKVDKLDHADSGVDFVVELNGQLVLGQVKRYSGKPRRRQGIHVSPRPRSRRTRFSRLVLVPLFSVTAGMTVGIWWLHNPFWLTAVSTASAVLGQFQVRIAIRAAKSAERPASQLARLSACGLTALAALLAGRRRLAVRDEWRAHLAGESGHDPVTWRKAGEALGFVSSAIQYRLADAAEAAWAPFDAILKSRKLSNLVVFGPTAMAALVILRHEGTVGVLKSAESISAIGGLLYGLIRAGRWWRNVKPPEPKARRAEEQ